MSESPQECAWVIDSAAAYALGALEPDDAARVTRHLSACDSCSVEIASLGAAVPLLGLAPEQRDPSPVVRRRLIASLSASAVVPDPVPIALPAIPPTAMAPARAEVRRRPALSSRFATASLLVAILILGIWTIGAQRDLNARDDEIERLNRENEALALHLDSIKAGQQVLGNSGVWYPLARVNTAAEDAGGIMLSAQQGTTTLLSVWNMPEEHDRYHVICESKLGELLSAGEIEVNDRGNGYATLTLPAPVSEYRAVHVIPTSQWNLSDDAIVNDILQLLIAEPTMVATVET